MTIPTKTIKVSNDAHRQLKQLALNYDENVYEVVERLLSLEANGWAVLRRLEHLNSEETGRCPATVKLRRTLTTNGTRPSGGKVGK